MNLLNPLVVNAFDPSINRHTVKNTRKVGFGILEEEYLLSSIFRITVTKPFNSFLA